MTSCAEDFHALHYTAKPLMLPNAWDYASAALLADAGFPAIGTTSLGVAAAAGLPDGHGATRDETLALAQRLRGLSVLITVDVEAGFSDNPDHVADYIARLAALGVVGVNVEDGRPDGALRSPALHAAIIHRIKARTPHVFVNARTDTYWAPASPPPLTETLRRCHRYIEAGADGIFVPGLTDPDSIAQLTAAAPAPVNILAVPNGPTVTALAALGVRRISTGSLLYRAALTAALKIADQVDRSATVTANAVSYRAVAHSCGGGSAASTATPTSSGSKST
ncbi:MAG: isocitrate lyase/PEP mutase family protein [Stackebrandtia sp.]